MCGVVNTREGKEVDLTCKVGILAKYLVQSRDEMDLGKKHHTYHQSSL